MQAIISIELLALLEQLDKGNMITSSLCSFLAVMYRFAWVNIVLGSAEEMGSRKKQE